jgi:hypothetical protein
MVQNLKIKMEKLVKQEMALKKKEDLHGPSKLQILNEKNKEEIKKIASRNKVMKNFKFKMSKKLVD